MSDEIAAPVAEAPVSAPSAPPAENTTDSIPADTPQPIKSETPAKVEVVQPKKSSPMDSINRATDKFNKEEAAAKKTVDETKPLKAADAPKEAAKLDDKGKPIVEAIAKPKYEAPERWTPTAKEKFKALDEEVQSEVVRTYQEQVKGIEKYKESATKYDELKPYEDMAKQYKTTVKAALDNYIAIDKSLQSQNPQEKQAALNEVFRIARISPQEFAKYVLGQPQDQVASRDDAEKRAMREELAQLRQEVKGVTTNIKTQEEQRVIGELNQWAQDKPLANHLADQIAAHYQAGLPLDEAYAKAEQEFREMASAVGFIPQPQTPQGTNVVPLAQTQKGLKSITGAPSAGSYPATQPPSKTVSEAVAKAMAAHG